MSTERKIRLWDSHRPVNWLIVAALVIVADQVTKYLVVQQMGLFDSISIVPHLNLTLLHNTGAAFSFLADAGGWQRWFFVVLGTGVSLFILLWLRRMPADQGPLLPLSLSLILGGALGNVIDRAWHGYVIDFVDVYYGSWHWPAFNVADSAITVGAVIFILDSILDMHREATEKRKGAEK
ncbi:MAG: signal peptidase II [Proteobacteria bacterium]|nr:signal peptidase II [Pseudomonadota bacterium]